MQEIELKLALTPEGATALETAGIFPAAATVRTLSAVYHDTPKSALAKAGISLRIRASGAERIQTVKKQGEGSAGLFVRSEWEIPVTGDTPVLDDTTPVKALLGDHVAKLAPRFAVNVTRSTWLLEHADAEIEVALDRGEVISGDASAPICEIELELKSGKPGALFAFARKLDAVAPVRLGVLTKPERGYRLIERPPLASKAGPVSLQAEGSVAASFQQVAQTCIRHFRLNEAVLLAERSPKALHQARVALRRLRSAFSIFKPLFGHDEQAAQLRGELRWLAGVLGNARDLDVLLDRTSPGDDVYARIRQAREAAYTQVEHALASSRVRAIMLGLAEWLVNGSWLKDAATADDLASPTREFAESAIGRLWKKVKKGGRDLDALDDEARHEVRKDAKKLRYASEFFVSVFTAKRERRRYKRFRNALEDLQDQLGLINDLATAPGVLRTLGIDDTPPAAGAADEKRKQSLISAAATAHGALVSTKRYWR